MKIIYFFLLSILTLNGIYCQSENDNNLSWESNIGSVTFIEPVKSDAWKVTICVNAVFVEACWEMDCKIAPGPPGFRCDFSSPSNITVPELVSKIERHLNMIPGSLTSIELSKSDVVENDGVRLKIKEGVYKLNSARNEILGVEVIRAD